MNKFNLEKALAGEKVITRDGREVTQLHVFDVSEEYMPLVGVVDGGLRYWRESGDAQSVSNASFEDIFMAPKKLSGFVNVYSDYVGNTKYTSAKAAGEGALSRGLSPVACIDLSQFDEGHGL